MIPVTSRPSAQTASNTTDGRLASTSVTQRAVLTNGGRADRTRARHESPRAPRAACRRGARPARARRRARTLPCRRRPGRRLPPRSRARTRESLLRLRVFGLVLTHAPGVDGVSGRADGALAQRRCGRRRARRIDIPDRARPSPDGGAVNGGVVAESMAAADASAALASRSANNRERTHHEHDPHQRSGTDDACRAHQARPPPRHAHVGDRRHPRVRGQLALHVDRRLVVGPCQPGTATVALVAPVRLAAAGRWRRLHRDILPGRH